MRAGCTLGDIIAEWLAFVFPGVAVALGWHSLFAERTFVVWIFDYAVAFLLGMAFPYLTIKPMPDLSVEQGIIQAARRMRCRSPRGKSVCYPVHW